MKKCWNCPSVLDEIEFPLKTNKKERSLICKKCTAKMRNGRKAKSINGQGNNYLSRYLWLQTIGFSTYREYLASELWKSIRKRVFKIKGKLCYLCGKTATEVHHNRYHKNDLTGKRLLYLNPICRTCHEEIEFSENKKSTLKQAKRAFKKKRIEQNNTKRDANES